MVAQQIALRNPRAVRWLVLGATTPGGRRAETADEEVMAFFHGRAHRPREEAAWASVACNYGRRCATSTPIASPRTSATASPTVQRGGLPGPLMAADS